MRVSKSIFNILSSGGVGVMPTDTIYGLVGSALNKKTVERIYKLRRRDSKKPMIILIGSLAQLKFFGIRHDKEITGLLKMIWFEQKPSTQHPYILENVRMLSSIGNRPTSVVLYLGQMPDVKRRSFKYLHRGTKTLAFRLPRQLWLRNLLKKVGPLVAPSANLEGKPPARTIAEAKKYFGDMVNSVRGRDGSLASLELGRSGQRVHSSKGVDFYVDGGKITGKPSRLIEIVKGKIKILRK